MASKNRIGSILIIVVIIAIVVAIATWVFFMPKTQMLEYRVYDSLRYQKPIFDVDTITDVEYRKVRGYWTSSDYDYDVGSILKGHVRTLQTDSLNLLMHIYV